MSELELLKTLQKELIVTLEERIKAMHKGFPDNCSRKICKAKFKRLRLQIQEVMISIENQFRSYDIEKEGWYKE